MDQAVLYRINDIDLAESVLELCRSTLFNAPDKRLARGGNNCHIRSTHM
jgi:hypothetical protein